MKAEERIGKQRLLIEEMGMLFDKEGYAPVSGRILALLMVMDKEQYTFDEIVEELQISKSSASTSLKSLEMMGKVEYLTHPGDRKRYFRMKAPDMVAMLEGMRSKFRGMNGVMQASMELKADPESRNSKLVLEMLGLYDLFTAKLEELIREMKER